MKFRVICADPPYPFKDKLKQSSTKRGAASVYKTMSIEDIKNIDVKSISEEDAFLALWCPSTLLKEGIEIMESWGFKLKQTHIWVKTKKSPLKSYIKKALSLFKKKKSQPEYDLNDCLGFGMGWFFRQTHEVVLIGTRGKVLKYLKNKSQRSVHLHPATKHSEKPENLQNMLDIMFPNCDKLEIFARKERDGWVCIGNESKTTFGQDVNDSVNWLKNL